MKRKKGFLKKNKALVTLAVVLALFFLLLFMYFDNSEIRFSYFRNFYYNIISIFSRDISVNYHYIEEENIEILQERVNELEKMLDLNKTNSTYDILNCNIVSYSMDNLFDTLIIDKGSIDGLETNMLVINSDGLVGIIKKVYKSISEVKLLTGNVRIPVNINGIHAILNDYQDGYLIASLIRSEEIVEKGSIVVTTKVDDMFCDNIKVGVIEDVYKDEVGITKKIKIKTTVDFYNLHYLSVLVGRKP